MFLYLSKIIFPATTAQLRYAYTDQLLEESFL